MVRADEFGDTLWTTAYDETHHLYAIDHTPDGGYYVSGDFSTETGTRFSILKINDNHELQWIDQHRCGMPYGPTYAVLRTMPEGGCVAITSVVDSTVNRMELVKVDSAGQESWSIGFGTGYYEASAILPTNDSGFVVAGSNSTMMLLIKYAYGSHGAVGHVVILPIDLSFTAYPNPFNGSTTLSYNLPRAGRIEISLYDILGRQIQTLSDQRSSAGLHTSALDGTALPSGIYFARLQSAETNATIKLQLLK